MEPCQHHRCGWPLPPHRWSQYVGLSYLKHDPAHNLSLEIEGRVAHNGHLFANEQWDFIKKKQSTVIGMLYAQLPDWMPTFFEVCVIVSKYPFKGDPRGRAEIFPPTYMRPSNTIFPRHKKTVRKRFTLDTREIVVKLRHPTRKTTT